MRLVIITVLCLLLIGCGAQTQTNTTQAAQPSNDQVIGSPSQPSTSSVSTQLAKYARFEAQLVCDQFGGTEDVDLTAIAEKAEAHAKEAGFSSLEEASAYGKTITDQTKFKQMFSAELQSLCPDAIGNANAIASSIANN